MPNIVRIMPTGIDFPCQEGQTILDAALSRDIALEYSCSNGRCGQCHANLLEGAVDRASYGENIELPPEGLLTCSSKPLTNIVIEAHYHPELQGIKRKMIPAKVEDIAFANSNVLVLTLRMPPSARFSFLSGQYIDLHHNGESRSYSIANAGVENNKIELHIKEVSGGLFSNFLFYSLTKGQLLRFFGPMGTFFLRDGDTRLIFLCTGTGFAPVKSMVENLIAINSSRSIHIYWGGREISDLYSDLPFIWAQRFDNIKFTPVVSREKPLPEDSVFGYVQNAVTRDYVNLNDTAVYACGSEIMIREAQLHLLDNGLDRHHFYSDAFLSSSKNTNKET